MTQKTRKEHFKEALHFLKHKVGHSCSCIRNTESMKLRTDLLDKAPNYCICRLDSAIGSVKYLLEPQRPY